MLDLSANKLTALTKLHQPQLFKLVLAENAIASAALFTGHAKLLHLDLRKNQLTSCQGLANCASLEELLLGENQIANTDGLADLPNLRLLDLNTNKLTSLAGIKNLPALRDLDVGANTIEKGDSLAGLVNFKNLTRVVLAGNPFADELGDRVKFELLFRVYPYVKLQKVNDEEIGEEDIAQWKSERRERMKQEEEALRLAAEKAARGDKEEGQDDGEAAEGEQADE